LEMSFGYKHVYSTSVTASATVNVSLYSSLTHKMTKNRAMMTHPMYCSVLLYFLARYLADALLGILTKDISLP